MQTITAYTNEELMKIEKRCYEVYKSTLKEAIFYMDNRHTDEKTVIKHWKKVCKAKNLWFFWYNLIE